MRALFIRTSVLCGLFLVLAVAGKAQLSPQYRAAIPFDFQVRNLHFAAGDYSVGPVGGMNSSGGLAIWERATGKAKILGLSQLGAARSERAKLIFTKMNGVYTLTEVNAPTFGIRMRPSKRPGAVAINQTPKTETVIVFLDN